MNIIPNCSNIEFVAPKTKQRWYGNHKRNTPNQFYISCSATRLVGVQIPRAIISYDRFIPDYCQHHDAVQRAHT